MDNCSPKLISVLAIEMAPPPVLASVTHIQEGPSPILLSVEHIPCSEEDNGQ